jgi:hypothetical protein
MKKLSAALLIVVMTVSSRAGELPSSFEQAAALADSQEKQPAARGYVQDKLMPYYQEKYGPIFQSCLASAARRDVSPFSFVVAIGRDGRVLRVYIDHESKIFACLRQTLQQDKFPAPPLAPYYMHISMSFPE